LRETGVIVAKEITGAESVSGSREMVWPSWSILNRSSKSGEDLWVVSDGFDMGQGPAFWVAIGQLSADV